MKLSTLGEHTAKWLSLSVTSVSNYARSLREAKQVSGGIKGGGAADMTPDDKISLFVAVAACGTAKTCATALPSLLRLPAAVPEKSDNLVFDSVDHPRFFGEPDMRRALLSMFRCINNGDIERWCSEIENTFSRMTGDSMPIQRPLTADLSLIFEIDVEHVQMHLRARGLLAGTGKVNFSGGPDLVFGAARMDPLPGHSRRFHEISYERLKGWGECLRD